MIGTAFKVNIDAIGIREHASIGGGQRFLTNITLKTINFKI